MFTPIRNHRRHRQDTRRILAENLLWLRDLNDPDVRDELGLLGHNRQQSNQVHVDRFAGPKNNARRR
jgi:hypothetical protein